MNNLFVGKKIELGVIILSEQEIIDFAKAFDPLPFHTDKELARKTIFKGLIASGPHIFNVFYQRKWLPLFGKSVICGLGVHEWKFIKPIYPEKKVTCLLTILSMKEDVEIGGTGITWLFEFINEKKELIQTMQMEVMHKI